MDPIQILKKNGFKFPPFPPVYRENHKWRKIGLPRNVFIPFSLKNNKHTSKQTNKQINKAGLHTALQSYGRKLIS